MGSKFFKMDVDGWLMGCIDIPANEIVSANFTVISGPGYRTSIMLDDIFYNVNPCVGKFNSYSLKNSVNNNIT